MKKERMPKEEKSLRSRSSEHHERTEHQTPGTQAGSPGLTALHRHIGNQAVQRLLASRSVGELVQRSGEAPIELDEATAERIERARSGGKPLEGSIQAEMSKATGYDLNGVRAHTSPEADTLNRQLGAKAFTTGQDVFFRQDTYDPHATAGQELIAHELTHVVQQGSGMVHSGGRMTVSAPGDVHEQQADASAQAVVHGGAQASVQRQDEEEQVQMQEEEEEIQMQEDEEEEVQMQNEEEEEEEEVQP